MALKPTGGTAGPVPAKAAARPSDEQRAVIETLKDPLFVPLEPTDPAAAPIDPADASTAPAVATVPEPSANGPGWKRKGELVGRYRLAARLAISGWAESWVAQAPGADPVVIKRVLPNLLGEPAFAAAFLGEAKAVAGLEHPNVVAVLDSGQAGGDVFLAMEKVQGRSLELVLRRAAKKGLSHLPPSVGCFIAAELLSGLTHAHQKGMVHGDLNPEHVLVGFDGRPRLFDFGMARLGLVRASPPERRPVPKRAYLAPEHLDDWPIDARSDVFLVGMLLFRMLCGRFPFPGEPREVLPAILEGRFPTPVAVNPRLAESASQLISTAMACKPGMRFRGAAEMETAVRAELQRADKGFSAQSLAAFMRWLFDDELEKEGIFGRPTDNERAIFEHWSRETQWVDLAGDTFKAIEKSTALVPMPDAPARPGRWVLGAIGAGALFGALWLWLR